MKRLVLSHIQSNKKMYLFLAMLFSLGLFIGTVVVVYLDESVHSTLIKEIKDFFSSSIQIEDKFSRSAYFKLNVATELKEYLFMWLCGLTVIGFVAAPFFAVFKGFVLGFTNSFFILHFQMSGFFFDLLTIAPQNLIKIPALFFACSSIITYSIKNSEKSSSKKMSSGRLFFLYSFSMLCAFGVSALGVIFQSFIAPSLIFIFTPEML